MYLYFNVILAELKADDWLASDVDIESMAEPKISVATGIELQYVMEDEWERARVVHTKKDLKDLLDIGVAGKGQDVYRFNDSDKR